MVLVKKDDNNEVTIFFRQYKPNFTKNQKLWIQDNFKIKPDEFRRMLHVKDHILRDCEQFKKKKEEQTNDKKSLALK